MAQSERHDIIYTSSDAPVIAQCQRCGRGYLMIGKYKNDKYFHPERVRDRLVCGGEIKMLATPVLSGFVNYGRLYATRQQDMAND